MQQHFARQHKAVWFPWISSCSLHFPSSHDVSFNRLAQYPFASSRSSLSTDFCPLRPLRVLLFSDDWLLVPSIFRTFPRAQHEWSHLLPIRAPKDSRWSLTITPLSSRLSFYSNSEVRCFWPPMHLSISHKRTDKGAQEVILKYNWKCVVTASLVTLAILHTCHEAKKITSLVCCNGITIKSH